MGEAEDSQMYPCLLIWGTADSGYVFASTGKGLVSCNSIAESLFFAYTA